MSLKQINLNSDLKKLIDDGYEIEIRDTFFLVHNVPYVNSEKTVKYGKIVVKLNINAESLLPPEDHLVYFVGEHPCSNEGIIISQIQHTTNETVFDSEITTNHSFSNKPAGGYQDYFSKTVGYLNIICAYAKEIDVSSTPKTFRCIQSFEKNTVFNYHDTNSSRADITNVSAKLFGLKIGIIGVGGTGSYLLDLVSKTPVSEIHIFDGDYFYQHNAFRSPGAALCENIDGKLSKVSYFCNIYSKMHKYLIPHECYVDENTEAAFNLDYVFICIDDGDSKTKIIEKLILNKKTFIDVGVGVNIVDGLLRGSVRTTVCKEDNYEQVNKFISLSNGINNEYSTNIQIAELNSLNASLAVIKWKKMCGFYHDISKEINSAYNIDENKIINDEDKT